MKSKPVTQPVDFSATYQFENTDALIDVVQNRSGYLYSRWDNPSIVSVENKLASLEGYPHALGFSSGMAAITTALMTFARPGSKIVSIREVYGGTFEMLSNFLPHFDVETSFLHSWETDDLLEDIKAGADIVYLEMPTNPLLRIVDLMPLVQAAKQTGALTMLDATFASPINLKPLEYGIDIVIHSATKYLGGHHDVTAGMLCCQDGQYEHLWSTRKLLGGVMDPMSAFLLERGLKTLSIRINKQNENALLIAETLEQHEAIDRVYYPGLPSHPEHELAAQQMSGFGGMLSFELDADFEGTKRFMDNLEVIKLATSLGGVSSLATQPVTNTHINLTPQEREMAGIRDSLVRLSVGVEEPEVLIADIQNALKEI